MIVCDQCGHVAPHTTNPKPVPYQPVGTLARITLQTAQCERTSCFCNLYVPRPLLPTEPAL